MSLSGGSQVAIDGVDGEYAPGFGQTLAFDAPASGRSRLELSMSVTLSNESSGTSLELTRTVGLRY